MAKVPRWFHSFILFGEGQEGPKALNLKEVKGKYFK
jgi:hypothetical protein